MFRLNNEQRRAVEAPFSPVFVIAGAGTGKTQALAQRVKYLLDSGIKPERILAITFTRKACEELDRRIPWSDDGEKIENIFTFHGFFKNVLESMSEDFKNLKIISDEGKKWVTRKIARDLKIRKLNEDHIQIIREILSYLKLIKDDEKAFERELENLCQKTTIEDRELWIKIFNGYCDFLENNGFMDFDDLELKIYELLETNPRFRSKLISKFDAILIDEFQDTSIRQFEIIKKFTGDGTNIFFVGDPDQSIYGFRGAIRNSDEEFKKHYKTGVIITLEQNYRSKVPILETANKLISNNYKGPMVPKKLWTEKEGGEKVLYRKFSTHEEERRWIVEEIFHLHTKKEVPLEEIVILYRNYNAFVEKIETAVREKYGWWTNNFRKWEILRAKWIRFIIAVLFIVFHDEVSISHLTDIVEFCNKCNGDYRYVTQEEIEKFYDQSKKNKYTFSQAIENIDSFNLFPEISDTFRKMGEKMNTIRDLREMDMESYVDLIFTVFKCREVPEKDNVPQRAKNFIGKIMRGMKNPNDKEEVLLNILGYDEDNRRYSLTPFGLNLSTIHSAKGLEFQYVFLVNMVDGILPSDWDDTEIEEERRLTYVAYTRAREKLYLSFSPWNGKKKESPFIEESKDQRFFHESK